jgi:hypothetical protein
LSIEEGKRRAGNSTQLVGRWGFHEAGRLAVAFAGKGRLQFRVGMVVSGSKEMEKVGREGIITELTTGFLLHICVNITQNTRQVP